MHNIYLDYNASAPLRAEVQERIKEVWNQYGNPSSIHKFGKSQKSLIEEARYNIGHMLNTLQHKLIFVSGATEANNLVLLGYDGPVIVSATEHPSVMSVRSDAQICPVDDQGIIELHELKKMIQNLSSPPIVCVMSANNETGAIQPIEDIIVLVHALGGYVHSDTVQALGKIPLSYQAMDSFAISGHKIGGPFGIGILGINPNLPISFPFSGGGQEFSFRPGTENVWGIAGLEKSISLALQENWDYTKSQRDYLERAIRATCPKIFIASEHVSRLPNTSMISMPYVDSIQQLIQLDLAGIACSNGSACSSGKVKRSHTLKAMGVRADVANSCIRVSLGLNQSDKEIQQFVETWCRIYKKSADKRLCLKFT